MYLHPERNPLRFLGRYCIISMEKQQLREIGTILHHAGRSGSCVKDSMVQASGGKSEGISHIPAGAPSRGFTGQRKTGSTALVSERLKTRPDANVETALRGGSAAAGRPFRCPSRFIHIRDLAGPASRILHLVPVLKLLDNCPLKERYWGVSDYLSKVAPSFFR